MPKPTEMEKRAIDTISSKRTRELMKDAGFPSLYILSLYHMTGRKSTTFNQALEEALKNSKDVLKQLEKVTEMTKRQLEKYEELKKSILYHNLKKEMDEKNE